MLAIILRFFGICVMWHMKYHSIASYLFDKMNDKKKQSFDDLLKDFNSLQKSYLLSNRIQRMKIKLHTTKNKSALKKNITLNHENYKSQKKNQGKEI